MNTTLVEQNMTAQTRIVTGVYTKQDSAGYRIT